MVLTESFRFDSVSFRCPFDSAAGASVNVDRCLFAGLDSIIEFALVLTGFSVELALCSDAQFAGTIECSGSMLLFRHGHGGLTLIDPSQLAIAPFFTPTPSIIWSDKLRNGLTSFMTGLSTVPTLALLDRVKLVLVRSFMVAYCICTSI